MKKLVITLLLTLFVGTASAGWYGNWYVSNHYKNIAVTQNKNKEAMSLNKMHFKFSPNTPAKDQFVVGFILPASKKEPKNYINEHFILGQLKFSDGKSYHLMSSMKAPFHDFSKGKFSVLFLIMPDKKDPKKPVNFAKIRHEFEKNNSVEFTIFDKNMKPEIYHFSLKGSSKAMALAGI